MKTDEKGCSTCPKGTEMYESFTDYKNRTWIQYDYRTENNELFSCVGSTLEICRTKRNNHFQNN